MEKQSPPDLLIGSHHPLGAHPCHFSGEPGVNFALWAPDAEAVELCLFDSHGERETRRLKLTGHSEGVWHGFIPQAQTGLIYGYRVYGPWAPDEGHRFNPNKILLDPWATDIVGSYGQQHAAAVSPELSAALALFDGVNHAQTDALDSKDNSAVALKARVTAPVAPSPTPSRLNIPANETIVYEAHVRSLTMNHPDVEEDIRGSYAALAHPAIINHLTSLGVTALELLPVHFRADERRLQEMGLANHWGYSSIGFFAPETRYWSGREGTCPESELRDAINTLHEHGIEVILDVVYNHTGETDENGPTLSFRGIANRHYYHLQKAKPSLYENWTGCGNCLNLAEPRVVEMVIASLRHWTQHYGIDGFRFDLGPEMARGHDGAFRRDCGFFAALQADPVLSQVKLIAEPWDIGPGGYQLGAFPTGWREWNDRYRDYMRGWWLKQEGNFGGFAHFFSGTSEAFCHSARSINTSVNFITAHDGFNLHDLVSYEEKQNFANGEHNRDGHGHNNNWNAGVEGPSDDPGIQSLRSQLKRNLQATLILSQGIPMFLSGDEIGHSQLGNNNPYCQDNNISWLDWQNTDKDLLAFHQRLIQLRQKIPALRQRQWLQSPEQAGEHWTVQWLNQNGETMTESQWNDDQQHCLTIRLRRASSQDPDRSEVLIVINRSDTQMYAQLPDGPWHASLDTSRSDGSPVKQGPADAPLSLDAGSIQVLLKQ